MASQNLATRDGRVRVGSVASTGRFPRAAAEIELLVTGDDDLSAEVAGMLMGLRPPVHVNCMSSDELFAALAGAGEAEDAEAIVVAARMLDTTTLGWMRALVSRTPLPVIAVVPAHAAQRSAMRERACEIGAIDCLLRGDLSSPLLEAAIAHARSVNRQAALLLEQRKRFALAVRGARDGMWEWDLVRGRVYYSQRWCELLGLRGNEIAPTLAGWLARVHPQDIDRLRANIEATIKGASRVHESEHRVRDGKDKWRWVMTRAVTHRDADGRAIRMAGSLADISAYRE